MKILDIKPTFKCPFNCPTCQERRSLYRELQNDKQLTIHDWLTCFNYAVPYFQKLTISGGEPLLYPDLFYMIEKAPFKHISLNTNAFLLDKEMSHKIIESQVTEMCISLLTSKNDIFLKLRGITQQQVSNIVFKNIQYFNTYKKDILSFGLIFLTKYNLFELPKMINLFQYLKFNSLVINLLEGNFNINEDYRITKEQVIEFENFYLQKISFYYREKIKQLLYKAVTREYRTYEKCNVPGNFCIVLANGDVHPCNMHEYSHEPIIGNLFDYNMNIVDIINNDQSKQFQKERSLYCKQCPIGINVQICYE